MGFYKRERLWLCKLVYIERDANGILKLRDQNNCTFLMILKENNSKVMDISKKEPEYFNLLGIEAYHAIQKTVYNVSDIGKLFVMYRHIIPNDELTTEELESGLVSYERILELSRKLSNFSWMS